MTPVALSHTLVGMVFSEMYKPVKGTRGRSRISERGALFGKALVLEARGPRGTCPPDFLKRGMHHVMKKCT